MIVEFISTPGAGKTTLLPVVREHFQRQGYAAATIVEAARPFAERTPVGRLITRLAPSRLRGPLLWQVFYRRSARAQARFRAEYPLLTHTVMDFQRQRPITEPDRQHVLYWYEHLTGYYAFLKAYLRPQDLLLLDEGFVHRVVQLFASECEPPPLARVAEYLDLVPAPDLVIFPNAPRPVCEQRVIARGVWDRFQSKSREDLSRFIANSHTIVNFAVGYLRDQGWELIEVDNSGGTPQPASAALREALAQRSPVLIPAQQRR